MYRVALTDDGEYLAVKVGTDGMPDQSNRFQTAHYHVFQRELQFRLHHEKGDEIPAAPTSTKRPRGVF